MGAMREPDQADFDLDRFIDMFDTAMTSEDPRVVETLRKLMMIVALTKPEAPAADRQGPLRRLYEDMQDLNRRTRRLDEELRNVSAEVRRTMPRDREAYNWDAKYSMVGAQKLAQQIDHNILDQMRQQQVEAAKVISGGITLGPENAKGKLFK
jgi:hypothetical protein